MKRWLVWWSGWFAGTFFWTLMLALRAGTLSGYGFALGVSGMSCIAFSYLMYLEREVSLHSAAPEHAKPERDTEHELVGVKDAVRKYLAFDGQNACEVDCCLLSDTDPACPWAHDLLKQRITAEEDR